MAFDRSRYDWYPTVTRNGVTYSADKVVNSDGSPRSRLAPVSVFTVHYGGAGQWLDQGDTHLELAAIERNHAIPQGKPNEYNSASDTDELTWEWAGPFRAAHSSGENSTAWGHLVVLGLEMPTEAQADRLIAGIRKARRQAVAAGYLTADHAVTPHRFMPDAQTSCPGPLFTVKAWWNRIAESLTAPTPPVTQPQPQPQPITGDDDMSTKTILIDTGNNVPHGVWYLCDATTKVWIDNGHVAEQLMYRVMEAMGKALINYTQSPEALPLGLKLSPNVAIDGHRYSVVQNSNPHLVASFGPIIGPRPSNVDEYGRKQ